MEDEGGLSQSRSEVVQGVGNSSAKEGKAKFEAVDVEMLGENIY